MKKQDILERVGLSHDESVVYRALAEHGTQTVLGIAEACGLHRPVVYKTLPSLVDKGLVSTAPRGKRTYFSAESPEKLRALFAETTAALEEEIPRLAHVHTAQAKKPVVKFLTGRQGIISVYEDLLTTLNKGDVFYRYSSSKQLRRQDWYVPKNYRERRDKKQIERFVITNKRTKERKRPRLERSVKIIPPDYDLFEHDVTQLIYGHKVAFVDYNTETAVVIENPIIAEFQTKIFKLLFRKL